jgi:5-methylcytosine-specific restriction endonuclease McrA
VSGRITPRKRGTGVAASHARHRRQIWVWLYEATDRAVWEWINRPRIGDVRPCTKPAVFRPRDHFKADGQPKARLTKAEALAFVAQHEGSNAYACSVCGAWHTGHKITYRLNLVA